MTETPDTFDFPTQPWVAVVANPFSGALSNKVRVAKLVAEVEARGLPCRVIWHRHERKAVLAHLDLPRHCRCIIAAGGDGTVADVINEHPTVPIAMMPLGTENLFAKQFGFDRGTEDLVRAVAAGNDRAVDVGEITASGKRFSLMLSMGVDAEVVRRLAEWRAANPEKLRRVRRYSYTRHILATLMRYPFPPIEVHADGQIIRGTHAFFFNLPRYGLGMNFAPDARDDDGLLDWIVFQNPGSPSVIRYAFSVFRQRHFLLPDVVHGRAARIEIRSAAPVPIQMDGDAAGFTPVALEVKPRALRVIVV